MYKTEEEQTSLVRHEMPVKRTNINKKKEKEIRGKGQEATGILMMKH